MENKDLQELKTFVQQHLDLNAAIEAAKLKRDEHFDAFITSRDKSFTKRARDKQKVEKNRYSGARIEFVFTSDEALAEFSYDDGEHAETIHLSFEELSMSEDEWNGHLEKMDIKRFTREKAADLAKKREQFEKLKKELGE